MNGFVRGLLMGAVLAGAGWIAGSIFPAPAAITEPIARYAPSLASRLGLDELSLENLRRMLSEEELARIRRDAAELAARAGEAIVVERDPENLAQQIAALPTAPSAPATSAGRAAFETTLALCPGMTIANAPGADAQRRVLNFSPLFNVEGVVMAVNPTLGACLSSSFGPRGNGRHNGVDYHARDGGPILAAADGVVVEARYRDDFGNMLLIRHGEGVYARYAHLSSFAQGVVEGAEVRAGQQIGLMGNTASYAIPIHLHYEVLTGDYDTPRASFGLTPRSPFSFPPAN